MTPQDLETVNQARRWFRRIWQDWYGNHRMDALEHESVFETMQALDELYARQSKEPQLARLPEGWTSSILHESRPPIGQLRRFTPAEERAHAREIEDVCSNCGGRAVNGLCVFCR